MTIQISKPLFWIPSIAVLSAVLTVGVWIGHATEAQASYVSRNEYEQHLLESKNRVRTDSIIAAFRNQELTIRLDRIERLAQKLACKSFRSECL